MPSRVTQRRIGAQARMELVVADIDPDHLAGIGLQQAVEVNRRWIGRRRGRWRRVRPARCRERACELERATRDEAVAVRGHRHGQRRSPSQFQRRLGDDAAGGSPARRQSARAPRCARPPALRHEQLVHAGRRSRRTFSSRCLGSVYTFADRVVGGATARSGRSSGWRTRRTSRSSTVAGGAAEVHQAALGEQDDALAVGEDDVVDLRLDVLPLGTSMLQRRRSRCRSGRCCRRWPGPSSRHVVVRDDVACCRWR